MKIDEVARDVASFPPDYRTARCRFLEAARKAGGRLERLAWGLRGPAGEDLSIDIAWFGSDRPRRALVHSSGLHGIEGFAGSAIQCRRLSSRLELPGDCALVFVHILNPYGMSWFRRVNENNVDLNRNFLPSGVPYEGAPEGYRCIDSLLNPKSPPSSDLFRVRAAWRVLLDGRPALRQAVAGGQYEYPTGVFFGGRDLEAGPRLFRDWWIRRLSGVERVCAIDVHTGLGAYGVDALLVEDDESRRLTKMYGNRVSALRTTSPVAFAARGGLGSFLSRLFPDCRVDFLCQEFGTFGPLRVLHALREENRWHHYGTGEPDHRSKATLKEAFCPSDPSWRRSVLRRGEALLSQVLDLMAADPGNAPPSPTAGSDGAWHELRI